MVVRKSDKIRRMRQDGQTWHEVTSYIRAMYGNSTELILLAREIYKSEMEDQAIALSQM